MYKPVLARSLFFKILLSFSVLCFAQVSVSNINSDLILANKCFLEVNSLDYKELAVDQENNKVLFSVNREYWLQQLDKIKHTKDCGRFVNLNHEWENYKNSTNSTKQDVNRTSSLDYEYFLQDYLDEENSIIEPEFDKSDAGRIEGQKANQKLLDGLYAAIDESKISKNWDDFTSHHNRSAYTKYGNFAADHLKNLMKDLAVSSNKSVEQFEVSHIETGGFYSQPSIVAVLGKNLPGKALVISAHMDTNGGGRRPGADDDASGAMVVLEAARLLVSSEHEFTRPIYFIWYAAEEVGLVGSKVLVREATARGISIDSVLHLDTIGRRPIADDPTVWLLKDNVDQEFTAYLSGLLKDHVKIPVKYTTCGYACSDHASWHRAGFIAAAGFESDFDDINPYLHTANDTRAHTSMANVVNFTKLALAYAVDKAA